MTHKDSLTSLLEILPNDDGFPPTLPITHLSVARWFKSIVNDGEIRPRLCKVFDEDISYLFYGGVFYRSSGRITRNIAECPIAFAFHPSILKHFYRAFPFDTGALESGRFGDWSDKLKPIDRFEIEGKGGFKYLSKLIHYLFGDNESYLRGQPSLECKTFPEPMPLLYDFYSDDLSNFGADQRQFMVECQYNINIPFNENLLWIGYPDTMEESFIELCSLMAPHVPASFPYPSHTIINPAEIAAKLEEDARRQVIGRYIKLS